MSRARTAVQDSTEVPLGLQKGLDKAGDLL